jgi:hypothetical protein
MELHKRDHRGINQGLTASTKSKDTRFLTNCTNATVVVARRLVSRGGGSDRIWDLRPAAAAWAMRLMSGSGGERGMGTSETVGFE